MNRISPRYLGFVALAASLSLGSPARAFPGFFAGQDDKPRVNHSTHVVVMMQDNKTAVTILPDYEGPIKGSFVMVVPVPADVSLDFVRSMKRDPVDHIDQITAPRFFEFWEKDPCESGKQIQEWERDLSVKGAGFLGGGMPLAEGQRKLPKEMRLAVEPLFKEQEYKFHLIAPDQSVFEWLSGNGYTAPKGAEEALKRYAGMQMLVVEVDTKRIELTGHGAILSPFRYATQQPIKINSTLGLLNSPGAQETFIYTIHPQKRFEVKNYKNVFPPTNLQVSFDVKERMGEFYAGMHDLMLKKDPKAFLVEFAWGMEGCGEPCPNEPVLLHEQLTLGADFFESFVPEAERNPEPPELTDEEKELVKGWKKEKTKEAKEELKNFKEMRIEVARRKALVSRHKYVLTRLHHRYTKETLPEDIELAPAAPVTGGVEIPQGPTGDLPTDVKQGTKTNRFQTRYTFLHPNKKVINCENPERYRWGIPPRTYRGYRKIWTAQDIVTKDRKSHDPVKLVTTPYPALGLPGVAAKAAEPTPKPEVPAQAEAQKKDSGCAVAPASTPRTGWGAWALGALLALSLRRRRSR